MTAVAWVSHQWAEAGPRDRGSGLLSSGRFAGGAEMGAEEMMLARPDGVDLWLLSPGSDLGIAARADHVVVAATELLSSGELELLARLRPVVWLRSPQGEHVGGLLHAARRVVWASEQQAAHYPWGPDRYEVCSCPLDVSLIPRGVPKEDFALWAARDVWHKGRDNARAWAASAGVPLVELDDAPREVVLEHMGRARWFVHLPVGFVDPCPRTVVEAEIAGCELIVNELVGRVSASGPDAVASHVAGNAGRFWSWVLEG
jgi:hypothetical protein